MNNVNKSEGDNSDFIGVNRSVLSPLPKLGTMGSNWGEVRVTGFLYHLKKLPDFQSFCETKFRLSHYAKQVKDRRGEVKIPASTVFSAVLLMGAMGWGSLLRCDLGIHLKES